MDPTVILIGALTTAITALAAALGKLYYENRESWKTRCEEAERREARLYSEVVPALKDNVETLEELLRHGKVDRQTIKKNGATLKQVLEGIEGLKGEHND